MSRHNWSLHICAGVRRSTMQASLEKCTLPRGYKLPWPDYSSRIPMTGMTGDWPSPVNRRDSSRQLGRYLPTHIHGCHYAIEGGVRPLYVENTTSGLLSNAHVKLARPGAVGHRSTEGMKRPVSLYTSGCCHPFYKPCDSICMVGKRYTSCDYLSRRLARFRELKRSWRTSFVH